MSSKVDLRTGFQAVLDVVRSNRNASVALIRYRVRRKCISANTVYTYTCMARQVVIRDKKARRAIGC